MQFSVFSQNTNCKNSQFSMFLNSTFDSHFLQVSWINPRDTNATSLTKLFVINRTIKFTVSNQSSQYQQKSIQSPRTSQSIDTPIFLETSKLVSKHHQFETMSLAIDHCSRIEWRCWKRELLKRNAYNNAMLGRKVPTFIGPGLDWNVIIRDALSTSMMEKKMLRRHSTRQFDRLLLIEILRIHFDILTYPLTESLII